MGLFDKARELAGQNADKVADAIEKAAGAVDEKTGGKYADQIDKGAEAAKGFVAGDGEHEVVAGDGEHEVVADQGEQEPPSRPTP